MLAIFFSPRLKSNTFHVDRGDSKPVWDTVSVILSEKIPFSWEEVRRWTGKIKHFLANVERGWYFTEIALGGRTSGKDLSLMLRLKVVRGGKRLSSILWLMFFSLPLSHPPSWSSRETSTPRNPEERTAPGWNSIGTSQRGKKRGEMPIKGGFSPTL